MNIHEHQAKELLRRYQVAVPDGQACFTVEEVAARTPEKILRETIDPAIGLAPYQARRIAFGLGLGKEQVGKAVGFMAGLARCFLESDCSLVEINPLVVTQDGGLLALDAKIGFDDNGLFR